MLGKTVVDVRMEGWPLGAAEKVGRSESSKVGVIDAEGASDNSSVA